MELVLHSFNALEYSPGIARLISAGIVFSDRVDVTDGTSMFQAPLLATWLTLAMWLVEEGLQACGVLSRLQTAFHAYIQTKLNGFLFNNPL